MDTSSTESVSNPGSRRNGIARFAEPTLCLQMTIPVCQDRVSPEDENQLFSLTELESQYIFSLLWKLFVENKYASQSFFLCTFKLFTAIEAFDN